jgi:hypothetical protein
VTGKFIDAWLSAKDVWGKWCDLQLKGAAQWTIARCIPAADGDSMGVSTLNSAALMSR